ncbi:MAG: hypothetical protein IKY52_02020 [Clostridia bacterium]|nr:hypothetical protein [Clostridia bacterium]
MKKLTAWLLLAAMLLGFTACGGSTADETTADTGTADGAAAETEAQTIDPAEVDELPTDVKYDGYDFRIMTHEFPAVNVAWVIQDIAAEELTGERINDAVFERNAKFTERFGANVVEVLDDTTKVVATVKQLISAGDDAFDLFQTGVFNQSSLSVQGYILNMSGMDYLNFEKAWWDISAMKGMAIGDKIFHAFGDNSLNGKKGTYVILFNKALTEDAGVPNLYTTVKEGDWTIDKLAEYGEQISRDVNGDGALTWGDDVYGIGLQFEVALALFSASGLTSFSFNEDGSYNYHLADAKVVDAMGIINDFMTSAMEYSVNCELETGEYKQNWPEFRNLFMSDKIGFFMGHLGTVTLVGGDMNSDFGILPFPKVFEDQDQYYNAFQYGNVMSISVPKTCTDTTRTGLLTEAYVMLSHDTVLPAYYDYTLTMRNARDTESAEMLDIIFSTRVFDVGIAYSNTSSGIYKFIQDNGNADTFSYASSEAASKDAIIRMIEENIEALDKYAE